MSLYTTAESQPKYINTQNKRRTELSISNVNLIWKNTARQHRKSWIQMLKILMKPPKKRRGKENLLFFDVRSAYPI